MECVCESCTLLAHIAKWTCFVGMVIIVIFTVIMAFKAFSDL